MVEAVIVPAVEKSPVPEKLFEEKD